LRVIRRLAQDSSETTDQYVGQLEELAVVIQLALIAPSMVRGAVIEHDTIGNLNAIA
jgi:hypothetical protein